MESKTNDSQTTGKTTGQSVSSLSGNDRLIQEIQDTEAQLKAEQNKPPVKNKVGLGMLTLLGAFACIAVSFALVDFFIVAYLSGLLAMGFIGVSVWCMTREHFGPQLREQNITALQKKLDSLYHIDDESIRFYHECTTEALFDQDMTEVLSIIGQKYGYNDLNSAQAHYQKGEREIQKKKLIDAYKQNKTWQDQAAELHAKEQTKAREESSKKDLVGKNKYMVELKKWVDAIEKQLNNAEAMRKYSAASADYRPITRDWAVAGGIGSALGGAGLGVMTALNVQQENEKERERAAKKHASAITQAQVANDIECQAKAEQAKASKYLSAMEKVLIDAQYVNAKFQLLDISRPRISLTPGKNLSVQFTVKRLRKPTILSKPAVFDGVLKLSVYDKANKVVSTGYYIANGYGEYNYQNAGFHAQEERVTVTCPIDSDVDVSQLRCEVTPEALWFIEASDEIFRVDSKTITKACESYLSVCGRQAMDFCRTIV